MPAERPIYRPLGGKGRPAFSFALAATSRLYLGDDHLLYVMNERFSESYKRFYFRDIQALTWHETDRRNLINVIVLLIGFFAALLSWGIGSSTTATAGFVVLGVALGLCLLGLLINLALGPTCKCALKTAVHTQEVASLKRVRTAERIFRTVAPFIAAVQGSVTAENLATGTLGGPEAAGAMAPTPTVAAAGFALPARPIAALRQENGMFHALLFGSMLLDGTATTIDFFYNHLALTLLSNSCGLAVMVFVVAALIRQRDSDVGVGLRRVVWATLVYLSASVMLMSVYYLMESVTNPNVASNQWEWLKALSDTSPYDSPLIMAIFLTVIVCSFVLGVAGFLLLWKHRRTASAAPVGVAPSPLA
jgi:small-conductance mechanosensitive channel